MLRVPIALDFRSRSNPKEYVMKLLWLSPVAILLTLSAAAAAAPEKAAVEAKPPAATKPPVDLTKDVALAKKALAKAKITMSEAVEIALKEVPGKAVAGELVAEGDELDFMVEVIVDGKHKDVEIDAVSGKVEGVEDVSAED